jgi:hypothetical protein
MAMPAMPTNGSTNLVITTMIDNPDKDDKQKIRMIDELLDTNPECGSDETIYNEVSDVYYKILKNIINYIKKYN